jgi:hypothetical protein
VLLTWLEPTTDGSTRFRLSRLTDETAGDPVTIAAGKNFVVNWADVPAVFKAADGTLVAHWLEKNAANGSAYDIKLALSGDAGKTWKPAGSPHHDGTAAEHGFVSFFDHPRGGIGVVWLDGRQMADHGGGHAAGGAAALMLRATQVTIDAKRTAAIGEDVVVDPRVCDCCPTLAAATTDGAIVAYRDRSATEVRDISVSRFDGKTWSPPARRARGQMGDPGLSGNGPAIVARGSNGGRVLVHMAGGVAHDYVAFSRDGGRSFSAIRSGSMKVRLSDARVDGDARCTARLVGYIERAGSETALFVRQVGVDGRVQPAVKIAPVSSARASGFADGRGRQPRHRGVDRGRAGRAAGVRLAALRWVSI